MQNKILTNFWFKRDGENVFHAFLQPRPGLKPVCCKGMVFDSLETMIIPHALSKCCNVCMDGLYGTKTAMTMKEHHES